MNFLELAKRLRQECGVNGVGPASVLEQTGEAKRLVDWINTAWLEIQGLHDNWGFMREDFSFQTVIGTGDYTPADAGLTDHRYWHTDTFRTYETATGVSDEQYLIEWPYADFRNIYRYGLQTSQRPCVFAIKPNGSDILLGPKPNAVFTVAGEYQRAPTELAANADIPDLPTHLHMLIVYKAMEYYGLYEAASEVLSRGQAQSTKLMAQLEREELPAITLGRSLA